MNAVPRPTLRASTERAVRRDHVAHHEEGEAGRLPGGRVPLEEPAPLVFRDAWAVVGDLDDELPSRVVPAHVHADVGAGVAESVRDQG